MKRFGNKNQFSIEYASNKPDEYSCFRCWIQGKNISEYIIQGIGRIDCHCDVNNIGRWFTDNWEVIMSESEFPLGIQAKSSADFYDKSGDFDSDDDEVFYRWFETRQKWYFSHSWYSSRRNEYIPNVFFRRIHNMIEIEWDSSDLYDDEGVQYICPKGIYYIKVENFKEIIGNFIESLIYI